MRIYLLGFMGSGKTTFGKAWAALKGYDFIDLDKEIEQKTGLSISEIFAQKGEAFFRQQETGALKNTEKLTRTIIATGGGTPCKEENLKIIKKAKSLYLKTPENILFERLKKEKAHRPLISDLNDEQLKKFIKQKLQEREKHYLQANHIIYPQQSQTLLGR